MKKFPLSLSKGTLLFQFLTGPFLFCTNPSSPLLYYEPPITFSGFFNGVEVSMRGNAFWPNRCRLKRDTIQMFFYSDNFSEVNKIRNGDFMRIYIFQGRDSLIGVKHMILHLARYHEYNSTYTILPRDTASAAIDAKMYRVALNPSRGSRVYIDRINMYTIPITGSSGEQMEITKGIITGAVE
jgi:hypothetical protein